MFMMMGCMYVSLCSCRMLTLWSCLYVCFTLKLCVWWQAWLYVLELQFPPSHILWSQHSFTAAWTQPPEWLFGVVNILDISFFEPPSFVSYVSRDSLVWHTTIWARILVFSLGNTGYPRSSNWKTWEGEIPLRLCCTQLMIILRL